MNVMGCRGCKLYYWTEANKVYVQLISNNQSFNARQNISQRKSGFYTRIMVFLKLSLLHVNLRGDAMALRQLFMYLPYMWKMRLYFVYIYIYIYIYKYIYIYIYIYIHIYIYIYINIYIYIYIYISYLVFLLSIAILLAVWLRFFAVS